MKKIVIVGFIICLFPAKIFSQNIGAQYSPEERAQIQTEWMKETLQLNAGQVSKVDSLNLEYALKMEKVKSVQGRISQLKEAREISEEKDGKLKQMMDEGQFETYLKKRKELRKKMNEIRKGQ
ncbi:hypothetical protein GM418_23145 [Maribellus comscasis]|jgi:hypothetical protein|uniref:DUF4890 domain-containing protein n=1 Tax=Maribellus comscasis TaxID=2681766 RepID=A0A6I6K1Y4_9BACT|nr:hypothetical protein [Maribellus comscasis]QGY46452.1 hypothetical protein GM418_23145 [Maribellus comscasis]